MATTRSLLSERRSTLFLSLTFLLLSLIVIIFFATDASNRLSSFYFTSSTDLVSSHSISLSPPFQLVLTSTPNSRINVSHIGDETPELDKIRGENGVDEDGREDTKDIPPRWEICRKEKGLEVVDIIPCLDNMKAIKALKSRRRMEHRERHCPNPSPRCLVPLPLGYKIPVPWPKSRDMIWYSNVPHPKLVKYKKDQNWVTKSGEFFDFPGGGTQFKGGVNSYIQFIEQTLPAIEWGRHTRVVLDVGCGVASFGGYLLDKDVITLSLAPKDEHEAQIQFALERGIPAILSVIGTQQLTFPDDAFDLIHCARCRVHWDGDGGKPLMELNRVLRPGGFFVWSATPVYRDDPKDQSVWNAMVSLTESICWKQVVKASDVNGIGVVIYQKPTTNTCYEERKVNNPPVCIQKNRLNISWYTPLEGCLPLIHSANSDTQRTWPISWPERLIKWTSNLFETNSEYFEKRYHEDMMHWETIVLDVYMHKLEIRWSAIRNVLDMNAVFGGFAAVLVKEPVWVMNVVPIHELDTLPVIFNRGLIGTYHDWCESFNTYPRTYDLIHSSFLFGNLTKRCECVSVVVEMDRILRPGGWVLIHDTVDMIKILRSILHSLHWDTSIHEENFLIGKKGFWRPL